MFNTQHIITIFIQSRVVECDGLVVLLEIVVVAVLVVVVASPISSKSLNAITFWHSSIFCPCEWPRNVGAIYLESLIGWNWAIHWYNKEIASKVQLDEKSV